LPEEQHESANTALETKIEITATRFNILHHDARRCNTLQHRACLEEQLKSANMTFEATIKIAATRCNTLQHAATHCNTLQHTITQSLPGRAAGVSKYGIGGSHY